MNTFYTRFLLVLMTLLSFYLVNGQVIFEDNFESGELGNNWTARPNLAGSNGTIGVAQGIGTSGSFGVLIGKTSDAGGFTTNALDLLLDLSGISQVELTFSIYDFYVCMYLFILKQRVCLFFCICLCKYKYNYKYNCKYTY